MSKYNRKDHFYQQAKEAGVRSRAYYKLKELDKRFGLFSKGDSVLDLGAWPGSWIEYVLSRVGRAGKAVGIDITKISKMDKENVLLLEGDVRDDELIAESIAFNENQKFNSVISDMSVKLIGIKDADNASACGLAELALAICYDALGEDGNFVCKVFKSNDIEQLIRKIRPAFTKITRAELDSTRKTSKEFYIVGVGFKPDVKVL